MADIQISATGGDVTAHTSIQTSRGVAATDTLPVQDGVERLSPHEREEMSEMEVSREGRSIVPSSECGDPLHYEDPVMHISGTGHWFLEGWIGDHSVEFLVDSGSSVTAMSDVFAWCRRALRWAHFRLHRGRCAARMELALKYWGVRAARYRFWGYERSSPLLFAAWRREQTRSLGQMCWDRCCHIH